MKQIATLRVSEVTAKYGEHAPMATVCCNACRTCVQTNLLGSPSAASRPWGIFRRAAAKQPLNNYPGALGVYTLRP